MSFISVAAGQPIRATHVQQFTNWLTAIKIDTPGTIAATSTTEYTLTVRSQDGGTGLAFNVLYGSASSPTTIATFNKSQIVLAAPVTVTGTSPLALVQIASPASGPGVGFSSLYGKTDGTFAYKTGTSATESIVLTGTSGTYLPNVLTATGDMIYSSSGTTAARLAKGTAYQGLLMNAAATAPSWGESLQSVLTTQADLIYASAANTPARLAKGTAYQQLVMNGAATGPAWASGPLALVQAAGDVIVGSTANTMTRVALGTKGYALLAGDSAPQWGPLARRNRLINGAMRVKQRATMPTTDDAYCLDGWNLLLEAANAATVTQETSDVPTDGSKRALKLTVGSGNNNKFGAANFLEFLDCADLRGKTVSLQLKMKVTTAITSASVGLIAWTSTADSITSDVVSAWGGAGTNPTLASGWAYIHAQPLAPTTSWVAYKIEGLPVGTSANNLGVVVWCDDKTTTQTTDYMLVTDVQLEEGAICTQFDRQLYAAELAACQRYVRIMGANGNGTYNAATRILISQTFDPPMRAAPTATILTASFQIVELGVGFQTGSGSTIFGSSLQARGAYLDIDGFAGLTIDKEVRVVSADVALFSAEL